MNNTAMSKSYKKLLSNNKKWVVKQLKANPDFFEELARVP